MKVTIKLKQWKMYDDKIMTVTGLFALHTPQCGRTPARSRENYVTTGNGLKNGVNYL